MNIGIIKTHFINFHFIFLERKQSYIICARRKLGYQLALFFDKISEELFAKIPVASEVRSRVLLNIEQFEIGQSYVTAKVENRFAENVTVNIQGGRPGIELQESLFRIKDRDNAAPLQSAYISNTLKESGKIFVRKLPVIGLKDWLLIYEQTLLELSVKDAYDELEIIVT